MFRMFIIISFSSIFLDILVISRTLTFLYLSNSIILNQGDHLLKHEWHRSSGTKSSNMPDRLTKILLDWCFFAKNCYTIPISPIFLENSSAMNSV